MTDPFPRPDDREGDPDTGDTGGAFWSDRFHRAALTAGFVAAVEGWLSDSGRVRRLAYDLSERELAGGIRPAPSPDAESSIPVESAD